MYIDIYIYAYTYIHTLHMYIHIPHINIYIGHTNYNTITHIRYMYTYTYIGHMYTYTYIGYMHTYYVYMQTYIPIWAIHILNLKIPRKYTYINTLHITCIHIRTFIHVHTSFIHAYTYICLQCYKYKFYKHTSIHINTYIKTINIYKYITYIHI